MVKKLVLFTILFVLACCVLGGQQALEKAKCEKKIEALLQKVLEMWNKPDYSLIPQLYSAECLVVTSSSPEPMAGHEGIKKWIEANHAMMPDVVMEFPEYVVQGDRLAVMWRMTGTLTGPIVLPTGTLPPSGKKIKIGGLAFDYLKDGKIAKEIVVFNALDMMMQMGFQLVPPEG